MTSTVEAFKELMEQYTDNRNLWIEKYGNDVGYDVWFTEQVVGK